MKKLESMKADKFSKKSLGKLTGGLPPGGYYEPVEPLPTRSIGTYVDGFRHGIDGYMD
ncbi:hypothetical protein AB9P05_14260 [Roseivirga sp. BDSF3-8]|uniref:hypothetical protein n=1 Tax=Roseivirga sp. BDSF3-8 TaxID=3241598 RepID=UPI0035326C62